jgi:hypothetical protein
VHDPRHARAEQDAAAPPTAVSSSASSRNCSRIAFLGAPSALRTPISRVRSVTATSMMFMTPMPPTSSEMDEIRNMSAKMPPVTCCRAR